MDYRRLASTFELRSRYEANRREAHLQDAPLTHASHTWHARSVRFGVDAAVVVNPLLQLSAASPEYASAGLSCCGLGGVFPLLLTMTYVWHSVYKFLCFILHLRTCTAVYSI